MTCRFWLSFKQLPLTLLFYPKINPMYNYTDSCLCFVFRVFFFPDNYRWWNSGYCIQSPNTYTTSLLPQHWQLLNHIFPFLVIYVHTYVHISCFLFWSKYFPVFHSLKKQRTRGCWVLPMAVGREESLMVRSPWKCYT